MITGDRIAEIKAFLKHKEKIGVIPTITNRQVRIFVLIAQGRPTLSICGDETISLVALKRDIRTVFNELGVSDRAHAVAVLFRLGILD